MSVCQARPVQDKTIGGGLGGGGEDKTKMAGCLTAHLARDKPPSITTIKEEKNKIK